MEKPFLFILMEELAGLGLKLISREVRCPLVRLLNLLKLDNYIKLTGEGLRHGGKDSLTTDGITHTDADLATQFADRQRLIDAEVQRQVEANPGISVNKGLMDFQIGQQLGGRRERRVSVGYIDRDKNSLNPPPDLWILVYENRPDALS